MASTGFLSEFPAVATEDWESMIRASVAGPDYPTKLIWQPEEGLAVKPYYRAEDLRELNHLAALSGEFPYVRGVRASGDWRIREEIDAREAEQANRSAQDAIAAGAEEISFHDLAISQQADLVRLSANLERVPLRLHGVSPESAGIIAEWLRAFPNGAQLSTDFDPLMDLDTSRELCTNFPGSRLLSLSAESYEESGAGAIEQIAFLLSAGAEFLDGMLNRGVSAAAAAGALSFSFSIGSKFFIEVAKFRAFRLAWSRIVGSFGGDSESAKTVIYARTARWNETAYDPHVNILRATTEAMSAIVGGADSISVGPFDECCHRPDQASRRLARNVQLVLKHEAGLARVADPLGGAYMIEALTSKIATKAWKLFQELEGGGGHSKAKATGMIDSIVQRRSADRSKAASQRKLVLTGTNRFANPSEKGLGRIDPELLNGASRVAQSFEETRLRSERAAANGRSPKISLARFGDPKMSDARAQFAADFLACAGLCAEICACQSPKEIAEIEADLIVLCSSDPEYFHVAEELMQILGQRSRDTHVAVAGNPKSAEELKQLGIVEFIHLGSNAPEVLTSIQRKLGIEGR